jgi:hypothetical protein
MDFRNSAGVAGLLAHQCVLRNTLAGSKTVVSISRMATVPFLDRLAHVTEHARENERRCHP